MTRTRTLLTVAGLAAGLLAPPVAAEPIGTGLTCSLEAVQNGNDFVVTVTGGPLAAPRPTDLISVRCLAKATVEGVEHVVAYAESPLTPGVAVLPPHAQASSVPTQGFPVDLTVCTEVTISSGGQPSVRQYDADGNDANGAQCAPAQRQPADGDTTVWFAPPDDVMEVPCATVYDERIPTDEHTVGFCPGG